MATAVSEGNGIVGATDGSRTAMTAGTFAEGEPASIPAAQGSEDSQRGLDQTAASGRMPTPTEIREAYEVINRSQRLMGVPEPDQIPNAGRPAASGRLISNEGIGPQGPWNAEEDDSLDWLGLGKEEKSEGAKINALMSGHGPIDIEAAISSMEPGLQNLLEEYKVDRSIMAVLAQYGFTEIPIFSKCARDDATMEKFIATKLHLDVDISMHHFSAAARLTLAWEAAVAQKDARKKEEAEARIGGLNRVLTKSKHTTMRRAYEKAHEELEAPDAPSPAYIEMRLEQIEDGELEAEKLEAVTSKSEAPNSRTKSGKAPTSSTPSTPEELRHKFKVMARMWEYIRLRNPTKPFLLHLCENVWDKHVEWLLGRTVLGQEVSDPVSGTIIRPSWDVVLDYEHQVRKRAYKLVNDGDFTIRDALSEARHDQSIYARYFQGPTTVQAGIMAARQAASAAVSAQWNSQYKRKWDQVDAVTPPPLNPYGTGRGGKDKGKDKGTGKGGKDKGKDGKDKDQAGFKGWRAGGSNWSHKDKKYKCFKYQKRQCSTPSCAFAHRCLVCDDTHPEKECPKKPPQEGDAAGQAVR